MDDQSKYIQEDYKDSNNPDILKKGIEEYRDLYLKKDKELQELASCFECTPFPILKYDKYGKIFDVNQPALELFGINNEEDIYLYDIFPGLKPDFFLKKSDSNEFSSFEFEIKEKNYAFIIKEIKGTEHCIMFGNDISKHVKTKRELAESQERYRKLSELAFEGLILHRENRIIDCNEAFEKMSGYPLTDILGSKVSEILSEDEDGVKNEMLFYLFGPFELTLSKRNGDRLFTEIRSRTVNIEGSKITVTAVRNISERKKAEKITNIIYEISKAVNSSISLDELYQFIHITLGKIIDSSNFFIASYDKETGNIDFPYFVDEQVPNNSVQNLATSKTLASDVIFTGKPMLLNGDQIKNIYREIKNKHWGVISKSWLGVPLKVKNDVIGIMGIQKYAGSGTYSYLDIKVMESVTDQIAFAIEQKKAEDLLKANEKKFRTMFENIQDVYYETLMDGTLTMLSPSFSRISNYKNDDFIGKKLISLYSDPEDRAVFIDNILDKGYVEDYEIVFKDRDGAGYPCSITSKIIYSDDGKPYKICGTLRNISRRKKAEEELKKSEARLQEAIQTKDKFFSILAHDLRSPFSGILVLSETLRYDIEELTRNEISDLVTALNRTSNNVYKLLNNLLEWAKIQRGTIENEPLSFNISSLITENILLIESKAKDKGITIESLLPNETYVYADYNMIDTVLRNLLNNGVKFTSASGKVIVKAENDNEGTINIIIEDNGIGIKRENLDKLFTIGSNISSIGTADERGTGLGLIICKEFVEINKGRMIIESEEGRGTRACFSVPSGEK